VVLDVVEWASAEIRSTLRNVPCAYIKCLIGPEVIFVHSAGHCDAKFLLLK